MKVAAFYRFLDLDDPQAFRDALDAQCRQAGLLGTVLVAQEGFNGTLAGDEAGIQSVFAWIEEQLDLASPLEPRWTDADEAPFQRMRVKVKNEIVTLGRPDLRPHERTGTYVPPREWNALIEKPDVMLIDTRNHYEVEVGTFPNAIDPGTDSFREFEAFARELANADKDKPLAMFCTGGIRCEKATALMLELGFDEVYHLQGGILEYLRQVPESENRWTESASCLTSALPSTGTCRRAATCNAMPAAARCQLPTWSRRTTVRAFPAPSASTSSSPTGLNAWRNGVSRSPWRANGASSTFTAKTEVLPRCPRPIDVLTRLSPSLTEASQADVVSVAIELIDASLAIRVDQQHVVGIPDVAVHRAIHAGGAARHRRDRQTNRLRFLVE